MPCYLKEKQVLFASFGKKEDIFEPPAVNEERGKTIAKTMTIQVWLRSNNELWLLSNDSFV